MSGILLTYSECVITQIWEFCGGASDKFIMWFGGVILFLFLLGKKKRSGG